VHSILTAHPRCLLSIPTDEATGHRIAEDQRRPSPSAGRTHGWRASYSTLISVPAWSLIQRRGDDERDRLASVVDPLVLKWQIRLPVRMQVAHGFGVGFMRGMFRW